MDINAWLAAVTSDAERRGLPDLVPLLAALARATETLRATDFESPETAPQSGSDSRRDD